LNWAAKVLHPQRGYGFQPRVAGVKRRLPWVIRPPGYTNPNGVASVPESIPGVFLIPALAMLIRFPDKREKNSNEESRKSGKEALKSILPAFLLPHLFFVKQPDQHGCNHRLHGIHGRRRKAFHDNRLKIPEFFFFFLSASLGGHFMSMHGETQKSPMHDKPNIPVPPKHPAHGRMLPAGRLRTLQPTPFPLSSGHRLFQRL